MHELDLSLGRCRYCRVDWDRLYKVKQPGKSNDTHE